MKSAIFFLALVIAVRLATAQEPPLPAATATPAPSSTARPELNIPDIPIEPSPLVPNTSTAPKKNLPSIQELDTVFQHSSLGAGVEEQRLHLEWRKLQNRAALDPDVIAAKKAVSRARTDPEKRDLMRAYYKIFYARMQALTDAADVKAYVEQKRKDAINGLAQPRLRPETTPRPSATP